MNARVVNGSMAREGAQVVVGDVADNTVYYALLCRPHFRAGQHQAETIAAAAIA